MLEMVHQVQRYRQRVWMKKRGRCYVEYRERERGLEGDREGEEKEKTSFTLCLCFKSVMTLLSSVQLAFCLSSHIDFFEAVCSV